MKLALAILIQLFVSLKFDAQTCTALFSHSPQSEKVNFYNQSLAQNAHYYWNFGDGTSSHYKNPIHEYSENGKYLVTLYVNDTVSNCAAYTEHWIIVTKNSAEACSPFINDSIFFQNGNYFVKFIDSSQFCTNYAVDYKVGWYSGSGNTRGLTKYPANYLLSAYYSLNNTFKRAAYKTSPNNYLRSKNYQDCSANFEFSVVSESSLGQRIKFKAMNKNAKEYKWGIPGFGSPIWVYTDTTSVFYPDDINSIVQNTAWDILLITEGQSGCRDSLIQAFVIQRKSVTYVGLNEQNQTSSIQLHLGPNPVSDKLSIEFGQETKLIKLSLLNPLGQIVKEILKPEKKLEISFEDLPSGVYLLKALDEVSQKTIKVIKE